MTHWYDELGNSTYCPQCGRTPCVCEDYRKCNEALQKERDRYMRIREKRDKYMSITDLWDAMHLPDHKQKCESPQDDKLDKIVRLLEQLINQREAK